MTIGGEHAVFAISECVLASDCSDSEVTLSVCLSFKLRLCHIRLKNFAGLSNLCVNVSEDFPLFITLTKRFESVGEHFELVD
jgi:hypothetical protein